MSESAGIGRQARLRGVCLVACGFKSHLSHHDWVTKKMSPNFFQYSCGFAGFLVQNPKNGFTVDVQTANRSKIRQSGASA